MLSTFRMVRIKMFCVLQDHFDLEGARHANLENKHDLVIKSHYKLMFALKKNTFKLFFFPARLWLLFSSFITEPFMSTCLCSAGKMPLAGRSWGSCSFPSVDTLCNRSLHCHAALIYEHLHLLGKASPPSPWCGPKQLHSVFLS